MINPESTVVQLKSETSSGVRGHAVMSTASWPTSSRPRGACSLSITQLRPPALSRILSSLMESSANQW